ncbi:hypothetical protein CSKR_114250 [Clonorchis sinensis]|uniref:Nucleolar protein 4 helical domain-containing protein n=1 Tax=Clonorchis sinensis TaxID=79923 RepID=A0A8T1MX87_CLOSI|nr:hypothetical protein CSKR_114250 [Clonorchis sinensis]
MHPQDVHKSLFEMRNEPLDLTTVIREEGEIQTLCGSVDSFNVNEAAEISRTAKRRPTPNELEFGLFVRRLTQDQLDHRLPITQQPRSILSQIEHACRREFPQFDSKQIRLKIRAQLKLHRRNIKRSQSRTSVNASKQMKRNRLRPLLPLTPMEGPSTSSTGPPVRTCPGMSESSGQSDLYSQQTAKFGKDWASPNIFINTMVPPITISSVCNTLSPAMLFPQSFQGKSAPVQATEALHSIAGHPLLSAIISGLQTGSLPPPNTSENQNTKPVDSPDLCTPGMLDLSSNKLKVDPAVAENSDLATRAAPELIIPFPSVTPNSSVPVTDVTPSHPQVLAASLRFNARLLMQSAQLFELFGRTAAASSLLTTNRNTECE